MKLKILNMDHHPNWSGMGNVEPVTVTASHSDDNAFYADLRKKCFEFTDAAYKDKKNNIVLRADRDPDGTIPITLVKSFFIGHYGLNMDDLPGVTYTRDPTTDDELKGLLDDGKDVMLLLDSPYIWRYPVDHIERIDNFNLAFDEYKGVKQRNTGPIVYMTMFHNNNNLKPELIRFARELAAICARADYIIIPNLDIFVEIIKENGDLFSHLKYILELDINKLSDSDSKRVFNDVFNTFTPLSEMFWASSIFGGDTGPDSMVLTLAQAVHDNDFFYLKDLLTDGKKSKAVEYLKTSAADLQAFVAQEYAKADNSDDKILLYGVPNDVRYDKKPDLGIHTGLFQEFLSNVISDYDENVNKVTIVKQNFGEHTNYEFRNGKNLKINLGQILSKDLQIDGGGHMMAAGCRIFHSKVGEEPGEGMPVNMYKYDETSFEKEFIERVHSGLVKV